MKLVSTSLTIFFKLFIPTFWLAFFGILIMSLIFYVSQDIPLFRSTEFVIGSLLFYFIGLLGLLYFFMRLKRVEVDDENIYVSNYFKTYKYTYENIISVEVMPIIFFNKIKLKLKQKGSFGNQIIFLSTNKRWKEAQVFSVFSDNIA